MHPSVIVPQNKTHSPIRHPPPLCAAVVVVSMETFSSDEACGGQHSSGKRWNNIAVRQSYTKFIYISKHEPWTVPYNVCCGKKMKKKQIHMISRANITYDNYTFKTERLRWKRDSRVKVLCFLFVHWLVKHWWSHFAIIQITHECTWMMQACVALIGAVISTSCWGRSSVCLPAGGSVWSYLPVTFSCGTPTLMRLKDSPSQTRLRLQTLKTGMLSL